MAYTYSSAGHLDFVKNTKYEGLEQAFCQKTLLQRWVNVYNADSTLQQSFHNNVLLSPKTTKFHYGARPISLSRFSVPT